MADQILLADIIVERRRHGFLPFFFSISLFLNSPHHDEDEDEDEEVMQGRESFPPDVLAQILLRLPARSVRRFRCVSKLFLALTSDPSFTYYHALRNANPLFLIQAQPLYDLTDSIALYLFGASSSHGVDEIALPPPRTKSFPRNQNPNLKLVASCNGFLCFRGSSSNSNYYVANPITKDWLFLPKSDNSEMGFLCGFYLHYPAGDYRLLLTVAGLGFEVCTVGSHSDSWRRIGWPDYNVPSCSIACPVLLHGCLHWMGSKHDALRSSTANGIVAFDTKLEEFRQISHPNSSRSMNRNHLLEIEGSLGLCQVKEESVMEIWVMKDYEREVWIKQHVVSTLHAERPHLLEQRYFLRPVTSTSSDGEIWLGWFSTNSWYPDSLILCNFKTNTLTNVEIRSRIPWRYYTISPVAYLDSLTFNWKL